MLRGTSARGKRYTLVGRRLLVVVGGLACGLVPIAVVNADNPGEPSSELASADGSAERSGVVNPVATPATVPSSTAPPTPNAVVQAVVDRVNKERTMRGLAPIRLQGDLIAAAQEHTRDQAGAGVIFHTSSDGSGSTEPIAATGYEPSIWGENIAAGFSVPTEVMDGWMTSRGHCENILNPAFTELGVGYVDSGTGYRFFWTQVFARPADEPRPPGQYDPAWCS